MSNLVSIFEKDQDLHPYSEIIKQRIIVALAQEKKLLANCGSLADFACAHEYFGMFKRADGWLVRDWAPNATEIYISCQRNLWQKSYDYKLDKKENGIFERIFPLHFFKDGDLYKFIMVWDGGEAERIPAYTRRVIQDDDTKIFSAQVLDKTPYIWKCDFSQKIDHPLIYEAHVGMATEKHEVGSYKNFTKNLIPMIKKAGYNTIQLMAVMEHPYYGSFGYHVANFFAASSRFGEIEDLKELIDTAHQSGLAVIMDMVHSHSVRNENEGLAKYDGSENQYFHAGERGLHPAWDSKLFNYGKTEVLHFLLSNLRYWLDEFRFDGFRFDGITSMLYLNHGLKTDFLSYSQYFDDNQDPDAITYLILANKLIKQLRPNALSIAEEFSGMPGLAAPLDQFGFGFDYRLAMGVPDYWIKLIKEKKDEEWDVGVIYYELQNRRIEEKIISYAESHDQALVGDQTLIFRLIGQLMYTDMHVVQTNVVVDRGIALHKMIRLFTLSTAGHGYLNFMGNEFGHPEWIDFPRLGNDWSFQHARRQWSLLKNKDLKYQFLASFDKDMLKIIKKFKLFDWSSTEIVYEDKINQIIVFLRNGLYFVFNFNPIKSFECYSLYLSKGDYKVVLNTDSTKYAGCGRLDDSITYTCDFRPEKYNMILKLFIYLPSRTAIVLRKI
jgi:1,4-alpha-glucan branching enzyme